MAAKKVTGAGPYSGYKKNYAPIKSSKGTKAEKVVGKVLAAAGGGVKPQKVKVGGKTMTTKPVESGLGVVGAMAKAVARTTARNAGKSVKGPSQRVVKEIRDERRGFSSGFRELREGNRDIPLPSKKELRRNERMDAGRGADNRPRSGAESKAIAKKKKSDAIARTSNARWLSERTSRGRVANGSISASRTPVPAKTKASMNKKGK
jgi:hypothetical protein